jgi:hypothetical protein
MGFWLVSTRSEGSRICVRKPTRYILVKPIDPLIVETQLIRDPAFLLPGGPQHESVNC